ncbi:uncharacterized protein LOC125748952 isoform X2 [Brienomyrus brachyistius]|uniref:uncharacterized protein LOC125748952 isoform X2 n=1 Tax=Brienomyrus brachyistius TaxID=42636 RepID=UPI0020B359F4|nr:uncharacterized protein LOC125748952 isoform X2 [Brienomyrus brachyistius]
MRPSSSLTCEPGAERVIPWGRDLFTFVTSAAGHMMRTLQKPRKNRPSKRQVNHRRFLHNMIHRKFAEIEAANHQLASAIFSRDNEDGQTLSLCQVLKSNQSDETPKEESSNVTLCLPVLSLDDPDPETVTVEQSGLWTISSHSHEHDFATANRNSETATNPLTLPKENLGRREEVGQAIFGELSSSKQHNDFESCFDFEVDPMKIDLMRFSETLLGENDEQKNIQNCNRSQATLNLEQAEAEADATQCPCVDGPLLRGPPAFHSDGQSLAFCDFMIPSIPDSHCSNTDLNNIMESSQSHILNDSGMMDRNRSEEDCMDLQSLSVSFWEAGDDGAESCKMNFSSAFVSYANSGSLDAIKNQQFNNHPVALSTDMGQSNYLSYDNMENLHRHTRSTYDPHLDTLSNASYHIDSRKPNYCSKKKMDHGIPHNERYNADTFTTVCPNLVNFDLTRRNRGGENDVGRDPIIKEPQSAYKGIQNSRLGCRDQDIGNPCQTSQKAISITMVL